MKKIRLATWNVNSVRAHADAVQRFIAEFDPDILCLQETKVVDGAFPTAMFSDLGLVNHALYGQKSYHGVATFSKKKLPLKNVEKREWCGIAEARHLICRIHDDIEIHNFYVPAGGDVPDVAVNPKFDHKLNFITEVTEWFQSRQHTGNRFILTGDLNIAPLPSDVWSHKQLLKVVSHTPIEVEHMQRWYDSHDWIDCVRHHSGDEEPLYSWWSYRSKNWELANKGRRLDHIWVTPALSGAIKDVQIAKSVRGWPSPSDHAPVIADFRI